MKLMKTQDAVGQVLCHDITQIIKGVTKDAVFRKEGLRKFKNNRQSRYRDIPEL